MNDGPMAPVLVADLGGTNARFGIVDDDGTLRYHREVRSGDHSGPEEAARELLEGLSEAVRPRGGVFAVAGPVTGDRIRLTNRDWDFSVEETRLALGLDELLAVNDFAALAMSLPTLRGEELSRVKEGERAPGAAMAVLGPGTGLGMAGLLPVSDEWWPVASEGGHRDLAVSADEREVGVFQVLSRARGHVSVEDVLSGPGLVRLANAIRTLEGRPVEALEPREVAERAGVDPSSVEADAVRLFSTWLGAVAGDLALVLDARGGVFLGGGILPRLGPLFDRRSFVDRFLSKGAYGEFLEAIPVEMILHPTAALLGAARFLDLRRAL